MSEIAQLTHPIAGMTCANYCAAQQNGHTKAELPVDKGYAEDKDIYFTHTEASDADLAEKMAAGCNPRSSMFQRWHTCRSMPWRMFMCSPME